MKEITQADKVFHETHAKAQKIYNEAVKQAWETFHMKEDQILKVGQKTTPRRKKADKKAIMQALEDESKTEFEAWKTFNRATRQAFKTLKETKTKASEK